MCSLVQWYHITHQCTCQCCQAVLHNSDLPKFLWAEAFSTAAYVHNRTPLNSLNGPTPYKYNSMVKKPDVSHLCVFSMPCTIIKLKECLRKLDGQATMCFFIRYKYEGSGYRVWDLKRWLLSSPEISPSLRTAYHHPFSATQPC